MLQEKEKGKGHDSKKEESHDYHHYDAEWHFHEEIQSEQQMLTDAPPFDIGLSGVSLSLGNIFGF